MGEIIPTTEFYTYDAIYQDSNDTRMSIPAQIPNDMFHMLRQIAIKAYNITCCEGMAMVDFF